jgi:thioredoxin 1
LSNPSFLPERAARTLSRGLVAASLAVPLLAAAPVPHAAHAATFPEEARFDTAAFEAAMKAGKPILVHITAPWCTTCAAQQPILKRLRAESDLQPLLVFNIDFDRQKALVRRFGARLQSTLIIFKGGVERGRSSGETQPAAIAALLRRAA